MKGLAECAAFQGVETAAPHSGAGNIGTGHGNKADNSGAGQGMKQRPATQATVSPASQPTGAGTDAASWRAAATAAARMRACSLSAGVNLSPRVTQRSSASLGEQLAADGRLANGNQPDDSSSGRACRQGVAGMYDKQGFKAAGVGAAARRAPLVPGALLALSAMLLLLAARHRPAQRPSAGG